MSSSHSGSDILSGVGSQFPKTNPPYPTTIKFKHIGGVQGSSREGAGQAKQGRAPKPFKNKPQPQPRDDGEHGRRYGGEPLAIRRWREEKQGHEEPWKLMRTLAKR